MSAIPRVAAARRAIGVGAALFLALAAGTPRAAPDLTDVWSAGGFSLRLHQEGARIEGRILDLPLPASRELGIDPGFTYLRGTVSDGRLYGEIHVRFPARLRHCPRLGVWVPLELRLSPDGSKLAGHRRKVTIDEASCAITDAGHSALTLVRIAPLELPVEMEAAVPEAATAARGI